MILYIFLAFIAFLTFARIEVYPFLNFPMFSENFESKRFARMDFYDQNHSVSSNEFKSLSKWSLSSTAFMYFQKGDFIKFEKSVQLASYLYYRNCDSCNYIELVPVLTIGEFSDSGTLVTGEQKAITK